MPCIKPFRPLRGCLAQRHVDRGIDTLARPPIEGTARTLGGTCVRESAELLVVENQPNLKARVRYRQPDSVFVRERHCFAEVRMMLWPLDVEKTPTFIDLWIRQPAHRQLDQRQRNAVVWMDLNIERDILCYMREPLQPPDIVGLRIQSLGEHHHRAQFGTRSSYAAERPRLPDSPCHLVSRSSRARGETRLGPRREAHRNARADRRFPSSAIYEPAHPRSLQVTQVGLIRLSPSRSATLHLD